MFEVIYKQINNSKFTINKKKICQVKHNKMLKENSSKEKLFLVGESKL